MSNINAQCTCVIDTAALEKLGVAGCRFMAIEYSRFADSQCTKCLGTGRKRREREPRGPRARLGPASPPQSKELPPGARPLPDFPGYGITAGGTVFKGSREVSQSIVHGKKRVQLKTADGNTSRTIERLLFEVWSE